MSARTCPRCQEPIEAGGEQEVPEEQGTAANLVYIHRDPCTPILTPRTADERRRRRS